MLLVIIGTESISLVMKLPHTDRGPVIHAGQHNFIAKMPQLPNTPEATSYALLRSISGANSLNPGAER